MPRDAIPVTCSASISLAVYTTTIAISAVSFLAALLTFVCYATVCSVSDLSVVKCRCLLDLLFDNVKCIHLFTPEVVG